MHDIPVPPPPRPLTAKQKMFWTGTTIGAVLVTVLVGAVLVVHLIIASGITRGPDNMFGDQHLKTAVALIELHKVRYGKYPDALRDLRFTGRWDPIALQSVSYYTNTDRTAYYVEVERGWVGKPVLEMPDEFWKGTGYSTALRPPQ